MTPADVLLSTSAYERREEAAYWRSGLVASAIYNVNRRKGAKTLKPGDFMPKRRKRHKQTPSEMAKILKSATVALGGEVIERGPQS